MDVVAMRIVILGLSITSSWGNGHATTYRGLVRELWRGAATTSCSSSATCPGTPTTATCRAALRPTRALRSRSTSCGHGSRRMVRDADLVIVGSYVPDGVAVGDWVLRDGAGRHARSTTSTRRSRSAQLDAGRCEYLSTAALIPATTCICRSPAGRRSPARGASARDARAPLYCSRRPCTRTRPTPQTRAWDLGYLGTYSDDRQPALERLLLDAGAHAAASARFVVAGPQYPPELTWPANVERIEHLPPRRAPRASTSAQRFTLNVTRADMIAPGWSPSVRLFEAAACGVPIISDPWAGLEDFFAPGREIVPAAGADDVRAALWGCSEARRRAIGDAARRRVLASHTADARARTLEGYLDEALASRPVRRIEALRRAAGQSHVRLASGDGVV